MLRLYIPVNSRNSPLFTFLFFAYQRTTSSPHIRLPFWTLSHYMHMPLNPYYCSDCPGHSLSHPQRSKIVSLVVCTQTFSFETLRKKERTTSEQHTISHCGCFIPFSHERDPRTWPPLILLDFRLYIRARQPLITRPYQKQQWSESFELGVSIWIWGLFYA